jgi:mono/diheme cytochrome c family protein
MVGTIGVVLCAAAMLSTAARADDLELPPGPDRALVYGQCRTCHDLQYLKESAGIPRDSWDEIINSMKQYGLRIPAEQRARILDYLGTYLGPNPPPAAEAATRPASEPIAKVDGKTVFEEQCAACHQPNGQGVAGQFPPLAHNADLFLAPDFPLHVVLFGIKGKITVNGQKYDSEMPPLDVLSDAQIAAVVAYIRQSFGNAALGPQEMGTVDAASVAAVRGSTQSPEQVLAYRKKLKATRASR